MIRILLSLLLVSTTLHAADLPEVKVENIRRAFHNGEHNAFTDLIRWKGKLWLTFRTCPDGHMVFPTSRVLILSSEDEGKNWKEEHEFSVPFRDVRDPHFLEFQDKLFVYTGTWWSGEGELPREDYDLNKHLGYAVYSGDGNTWSEPTQLEGTYGHYIWRAAAHDGKAYLCGRRKQHYGEKGSIESAMLESADGLIWNYVSLFQEDLGNETAFLFEENGDLVAFSRGNSTESQLARSKPPYQEWDRRKVDLYVGGPLLVKWKGHYLVGGRRSTGDGPKTTFYWLENDDLKEILRLPSGGDNSYPGFVELDENRALISWYSSHEKDENGEPVTAIYLAELVASDS